jgi:CRISPR-associated protein Cst2
MAKYLYGAVLTGAAVASNNRGENSGNMAMLQHVFWGGHDHTTVSSEAIRFAIRYRAQLENPDQVNRLFNAEEGKWAYRQKEVYDPEKFADDDIFGFMNAQAAKQADAAAEESVSSTGDASDGGPAPRGKRTKPKGTITKRRAPLAVARAVSLEPYQGELSFGSAGKEKDSTSLFSAEIHTTRYQYAFGLCLSELKKSQRCALVLDGILDPPPVAGSHSRFLFDFSPEIIVLSVSDRHSHGFLHPFDRTKGGVTLARLISRVRSGDLAAVEMFVGGLDPARGEGKDLKELGVAVNAGVRNAVQAVKALIGGKS